MRLRFLASLGMTIEKSKTETTNGNKRKTVILSWAYKDGHPKNLKLVISQRFLDFARNDNRKYLSF